MVQAAFSEDVPSLPEVVEQVRADSPLLAAARSRAEASRFAVDAREAEKRGEITPYAQVFQYDSDRLVNPISSPTGISPSLFDDQQYGVGLAGKLALDINGRIGADARGAEARARAAEEEVKARWLALSNQASVLYRGLQAIKGSRRAFEMQRDALEGHLEIAQKSVDIGRLEAVEVLRIRAARDAVVGKLAVLDGTEANLRSGMAALLHRASFDADLPLPRNPPGEPDCLDAGIESRPDIAARTFSAQGAGYEARALEADRDPGLALVGGVRWNDGFDADGDTTAEIGLRLSWPAYDGGRRNARARAARREEQAAIMDLAGTTDRATAEVASGKAEWNAAKATLAAAQTGHEAAAEAARVQSSRFEAGELSSTDLLDAEARLAEAADGLTRALVNWWRADDALYIACGLLPRGEVSHTSQPANR